MTLSSTAVLESHSEEEEDRWKGVPLAAEGQDHHTVSFVHLHHRFLLANGTLPKWRGGEGCKPKLHL